MQNNSKHSRLNLSKDLIINPDGLHLWNFHHTVLLPVYGFGADSTIPFWKLKIKYVYYAIDIAGTDNDHGDLPW